MTAGIPEWIVIGAVYAAILVAGIVMVGSMMSKKDRNGDPPA